MLRNMPNSVTGPCEQSPSSTDQVNNPPPPPPPKKIRWQIQAVRPACTMLKSDS